MKSSDGDDELGAGCGLEQPRRFWTGRDRCWTGEGRQWNRA